MKKTYFNTAGHASRMNELERSIENFNEILKENNKLGIIKIKTVDELKGLINNPERYIKNRLEADIQPQKILGLLVSKKRAVELLELPSLDTLIELCTKAGEPTQIEHDLYYMLTDGKKVTLSQDGKKKLDNEFSKYADTPDKEHFYDLHMKATKALKELGDSLINVYGSRIATTTQDMGSLSLLFRIKDGQVVSNDEFYLRRKPLSEMPKDLREPTPSPIDIVNKLRAENADKESADDQPVVTKYGKPVELPKKGTVITSYIENAAPHEMKALELSKNRYE